MQTQQEASRDKMNAGGKSAVIGLPESTTAGTNSGFGGNGTTISSQSGMHKQMSNGSNARANAQNSSQAGPKVSRQQRSEDANTCHEPDKSGKFTAKANTSSQKSNSNVRVVTEVRGSESRGDASADDSSPLMGPTKNSAKGQSHSENTTAGMRKIGVVGQNQHHNANNMPAFTLSNKDHLSVESSVDVFQHQISDDQGLNLQPYGNEAHHKSFGANQGQSVISDTEIKQDARTGQVTVTHGSSTTIRGPKQANLSGPQVNDNIGSMSNKSDGMSGAGQLSSATPNTNLHNQHCLLQSAPHGSRGRGSGSNTRMHGQTDGKKKRRSSDKHASGNKTHIKRIDEGSGRSQSRGNGVVNVQNNATGQGTIGQLPQNFYGPQFFDNATNQFNPFGQNFPFMNGSSNQAPQVHFIAKKQQFIAQISPEQLMNGDKRPYTAQSLNNLSAGSKRAGAIYGGGGNKAIAAAFSGNNHYGNSMNAKTHTGGFNFSNSIGKNHGPHKYSHSHQGDDMIKPKVAGKDILQALSTSNGFQSGYHSDPYSSVIGSGGGLPTTITHSNRTGKSKNRMLAKEKEQLYDETIKMKIMNNQLRDDAVKLKTKIKILENELNRKEKTIEDLFSHNQLIQQSQLKSGTQSASASSQNGSLVPLAQTAQKYQQETFLVMSLKKQIRELKYEVVRREEELEVLRKNIKNTKTKELEQEIAAYRDECMRMRGVIEDVLKEGANHPLHQQAMNHRMQNFNAEMQVKNQIIANMTEQLQQAQAKLDTSIISGQNTQFSLGGYQNLQMQLDQSPQGARETNLANITGSHMAACSGHATAGNTSQMNATQQMIRSEKSAERPQKASSTSAGSAVHSQAAISQNQQASSGTIDQKQAVATKEVQRDLQRARKTLREKDKELMKLKSEVLQLKRQREEAGTKEREAVSGAEGLLKTMKDKLKQTTVEMRRRDDRVNDMESKLRKLEEILRERENLLKQQEDANKSLKEKLKAAKTDAAKKQKEVVEEKKDDKKGSAVDTTKRRASADSKTKDAAEDVPAPKEETTVQAKPAKPEVDKVVKAELRVITLIGQREKLCRDDLTAMILSGEEALRMLIRKPSDQLVDFIRTNLDNEDAILLQIPRFDIPKADFETQVLREMRLVLRENADKVADFCEDEQVQWDKFVPFYEGLENFDYPHKDKLLEFIKYFFLDHIETVDKLHLNYAAFKEHVTARRGPMSTAERTRNESGLKSRRKSHESGGSVGDSEAAVRRRMLGLTDELGTPGRSSAGAAEEERMLDVAEQCFMRIADLLHSKRETVKQAFGRFATPESFKDGSSLDLLGPRAFLAGVREVGFDDITELEATSLMKVLAKPELDGAVILNEFILIMENFGIPAVTEEDEYENDYVGDTDDEKADKERDVPPEVEATSPKSDGGRKSMTLEQRFNKAYWQARKSKAKHPILIRFTDLKEKALKVLKKLARFLLERYMHPREFFGPTIKKEIVGKKNSKVEVIKLHDFYLRLKLASIRKKLKEKPDLNSFLAIDGEKIPGFVHVKRLIRALELIAEGEQEVLIKEQQEKERLAKEKFEQEQKERAEKGLPPLKLDTEEDSKSDGGSKEKKKSGADSIIGKEAEKKGGLDEMLKLTAGARSVSPSGTKDGPNRFSSQLGPQGHLNTIEEDLHETQTSHYSQQVKEGDATDRDGASSRHQLSTSNHLRNSNALHELEDSARRSVNNASLTMVNKASGGSGSSRKNNSSRAAPNGSSCSAEQYSGGVKGSNTSPKRESHKALLSGVGASSEKGHDISDFDVCIEQQHIRAPTQAITKEQIEENLKAEDEDEKEDLESEVDKKMAQVLESDTQKTMQKSKGKEADSSDGDEYYEDDREYDEMTRGIGLALTDVQNGLAHGKSNSHRDDLPSGKVPASQRNGMSPDGASQEFNSAHELTTDNRGEDTIKTDKIEAVVEEEMRARSKVVRIGGGVASSVDNSAAAASAPMPGRGSSHVFDSAQHSAYGDSAGGPAVTTGLQEMLLQEQSPEKRVTDDEPHNSNSVAISGHDAPLALVTGLTSKSVKDQVINKSIEQASALVGGGQATEAGEGTIESEIQKPAEFKEGSDSGGDYTYDDDELAEQLQDESYAAAAALAQQAATAEKAKVVEVGEDEQEEDYEI